MLCCGYQVSLYYRNTRLSIPRHQKDKTRTVGLMSPDIKVTVDINQRVIDNLLGYETKPLTQPIANSKNFASKYEMTRVVIERLHVSVTILWLQGLRRNL